MKNYGGATDQELQNYLGIPVSSEVPARKYLVDKNIISDSGRTRANRSGRQAVVWAIVDKTKG